MSGAAEASSGGPSTGEAMHEEEAIGKAEKAVTALIRGGEPATRAAAKPLPRGEGGPILDFERPNVYVRVTRGVEADRGSRRFAARRTHNCR